MELQAKSIRLRNRGQVSYNGALPEEEQLGLDRTGAGRGVP